jgi:hypothetical protein
MSVPPHRPESAASRTSNRLAGGDPEYDVPRNSNPVDIERQGRAAQRAARDDHPDVPREHEHRPPAEGDHYQTPYPPQEGTHSRTDTPEGYRRSLSGDHFIPTDRLDGFFRRVPGRGPQAPQSPAYDQYAEPRDASNSQSVDPSHTTLPRRTRQLFHSTTTDPTSPQVLERIRTLTDEMTSLVQTMQGQTTDRPSFRQPSPPQIIAPSPRPLSRGIFRRDSTALDTPADPSTASATREGSNTERPRELFEEVLNQDEQSILSSFRRKRQLIVGRINAGTRRKILEWIQWMEDELYYSGTDKLLERLPQAVGHIQSELLVQLLRVYVDHIDLMAHSCINMNRESKLMKLLDRRIHAQRLRKIVSFTATRLTIWLQYLSTIAHSRKNDNMLENTRLEFDDIINLAKRITTLLNDKAHGQEIPLIEFAHMETYIPAFSLSVGANITFYDVVDGLTTERHGDAISEIEKYGITSSAGSVMSEPTSATTPLPASSRTRREEALPMPPPARSLDRRPLELELDTLPPLRESRRQSPPAAPQVEDPTQLGSNILGNPFEPMAESTQFRPYRRPQITDVRTEPTYPSRATSPSRATPGVRFADQTDPLPQANAAARILMAPYKEVFLDDAHFPNIGSLSFPEDTFYRDIVARRQTFRTFQVSNVMNLLAEARERYRYQTDGKSFFASQGYKSTIYDQKYDGTGGALTLEQWIGSALQHLGENRLMVHKPEDPSYESQRVGFFVERLTGAARTWHSSYMKNLGGKLTSLTLDQLFGGLERRFVPATSLADSRYRFDHWTMQSDETVDDATRRLCDYYSRLVEPADPYTFRYVYFKGLTQEIRNEILRFGLNAHVPGTGSKDIYKRAFVAESLLENARPRRATERRTTEAAHPTPATKKEVAADSRRTTSAPTKRILPRNDAKPSGNRTATPVADKRRYDRRNLPPEVVAKAKQMALNAPKPTAEQQEKYKDHRCYRCQGIGHIASHCVTGWEPVPKLRAIHIETSDWIDRHYIDTLDLDRPDFHPDPSEAEASQIAHESIEDSAGKDVGEATSPVDKEDTTPLIIDNGNDPERENPIDEPEVIHLADSDADSLYADSDHGGDGIEAYMANLGDDTEGEGDAPEESAAIEWSPAGEAGDDEDPVIRINGARLVRMAATPMRISSVRAMAASANRRPPPDPEQGPIHTSRTRAKRPRPYITQEESAPVTGYVKVGNILCHTLLDTGCEGDMISPEAVVVEGSAHFDLEDPIPLQLATAGSRSSINSGIYLDVDLPKRESKFHTYFDIVNLDYYDAVLGTPFCRKHGIVVDPQVNDAYDRDGRSVFVTREPPIHPTR